jgi:FMN phosphatase YigB (HAD superfamily)
MGNKIKVILFDLDGTLLPMDQDLFIKAYFKGLAKKAAPYGYEPKDLVNTIWTGIAAMAKNDGTKPNDKVFWDTFSQKYGKDSLKDKAVFDDFYLNEFEDIKEICGFNPNAKATVDKVKSMGYRVVLATNPVFPEVAVRARLRWAGLDADDFEICTTYENSVSCKPNFDYYRHLIDKLNVTPEECLMVGNDVEEDMVVETIGIKVFLLTDYIINKNNKDISGYPNGNFEDLFNYIRKF